MDEPGRLSIVLQGGLSAGNSVAIANNCRHWRTMFPAAEIVLALSGTNLVKGDLEGRVLTACRLVEGHASDTGLAAALATIEASCDSIVLARPATPLPPIKSDAHSPNHVNLQIAAAQAGLAQASGEFVLRVRNDLILLDRGFIDQYFAGAALPRGDAAALGARVLVSWLFTLNPYTTERLPLHVSDWFHFGRLVDVRTLWDVPFLELHDAIHYKVHPYAEHSNLIERQFNLRLADEQFIAFHALKRFLPDLRLDYHNDHAGRDRCMDALLDNFIVCDLDATKCLFEKYGAEFSRYERTYHCITPAQWRALVDNRAVDYRHTLRHAISEALYPVQHGIEAPFPRVFPVMRLLQGAARRVNGALVFEKNGVLGASGRTVLPRGDYVARFDVRNSVGKGRYVLRATAAQGKVALASRTITVRPGAPLEEFELAFGITQAVAHDVEVILEAHDIRQASLHGLMVRRVEPVDAAPREQVFAASAFALAHARLEQGVAVSSAGNGPFVETLGFSLQPGAYVARLGLSPRRVAGSGVLTVRVEDRWRKETLGQAQFALADAEQLEDVAFVVGDRDHCDLAVVCTIEGVDRFALESIAIEPDSRPDALLHSAGYRLANYLRWFQK
ncbi:WavE lipopolysaccharide synthesis family protein [Novosphingobium sp. 1949]|uniref:WavE lipopolysaccharide synthesis family protein n=1 Tax=Novosphingobium organovorum TaxID=2930092 RepID=A0ABT0BGI3_9SPHN|nr:WavE lipopolysaccharide synthesis family protein [Novosphingobium organovorum]MCJ2184182.1 WavE lipopolysaccharide synthesis family protein [Novosphingobium organovorum]